MFTQQFFIDGLGCASYLIGDEQTHTAIVIDPDRHTKKYLDTAAAHHLTITHIIETHLHADHVSGNTELSARTGAAIYLPAGADAKFPHLDLKENDTLKLGAIELRVLETPGHTPESITLLVSDTTRGPEPALALTGDTLFVGDVGRPDLVSDDAARRLAGTMYDTLQGKLLHLSDALIIYPGHGAGSLCGRALGAMRVSSLGYERHTNPALAERTREQFIEFNTTHLLGQPANHKRIQAMNRQGPRELGDLQPNALTTAQAIEHFQRGAALLDTRTKPNFIARHIPGAVHLEANDQLPNRIGMLLPADITLVLLLDDPAEYERVAYMLARVGFDNVAGYLASLDEWEAQGYPVVSGDITDIDPGELETHLANDSTIVVLDVREPWEYRTGHVPQAVLIPLGQLQSRVTELDPELTTAVICQTGSRSQTAAALLAQKGFKKILHVREGTMGWRRRGFPIEN